MTWPITVEVKPCCQLMVGEWCDCASFLAEALAAFDAPIVLPPHADVPIRTDPALQVWRADAAWVEDMRPPHRWHATPDAIEVAL
ncbi:MAG TPA: hypothetical protein VIQ30_00650 [Pseudonocardia sp.]